jgi:hypothetical protein
MTERTPSMDDKDTPSPPTRTVWQYEADKRLGVNGPPYPSDERRAEVLERPRAPRRPTTRRFK